jgi:hypothetical protein
VRGAVTRLRCRFRRSDRINFVWTEDREVDHGEEEEGEETIHQEEGRSSPQEAQDSEDSEGSKALDQEKVGPQGCAQAALGTKARCTRARR